jgi:hypothetical protein
MPGENIMKSPLALTALLILSGCVSNSESRLDEAWDVCRYHKDTSARARCVDQQMKKSSAIDQQAAVKRRADEDAGERREAELEAQGVPRDAAKGVD